MGVCFSKKDEPNPTPPTSDLISNSPKIPIPTEKKRKKRKKSNIAVKAEIDKIEIEAKKDVKSPKQAPEASAPSPPPPALPVEKKTVFVITQTPKKTKSNSATNSEEEKNAEKPEKPEPAELVFVGLPKAEEIRPTGTVRTSSCTKEEVDAILIQCGRLSRSSSGKASNDSAAAGHRKYSGSKRSYDFDNDKSNRDEEEDWDQKPVSRPSPRRRTPNRERSGSRERGGSQRRVSRSPGRRTEAPAAPSSSAGGGEKPKQPPAKMVSVPAREKGVAVEASGVKRANNSTAVTAAANRRNASPRSRSPANTSRVSNENALSQPQSLSRSSSRKQEQSPCRRCPMTEIDDNSTRGNHSSNNANKAQKSSQIQTQKSSDQRNNISSCVRDQLMSCREKEKQPEPEIIEEARESKGASKGRTEIESLNNRGAARNRSSRRSSRDLDNILDPNSDNTSQLHEDIQNYYQQNAGFSLPACVSKACSILEAVADLNSSSSDQSNNDNGRFRRRGLASNEPFLESEVVVKDDLTEPSLHKYISVRDLGGESEPQESAGSNSFVGQPWPSAWELNSADSTDRYWNSQANNGEEVEETSMPETRVSRFRTGGGSSSNNGASATGLSNKKRDLDHHRQLQHGTSGVSSKNRAQSLPVAAATS